MNSSIPLSTYRLQLHKQFDFHAAIQILSYLKELGVSTIYCSPIFKAPPESNHGYDQCDPTLVNSNLGGEEAFVQFAEQARKHGLSLLVDFVPNHMATNCSNPYWMDVLRNGPQSRYGKVFDIHWDIATWVPKVTLPVLGDLYGNVLQRGEIKLAEQNGEYTIRYFEHEFPINRDGINYIKTLKRDDSPESINAILELQNYRLRHWKEGSKELNYRRFFAINTLIGVNVQEPEVRELMHSKLSELIRKEYVAGVRVDHIDGLADPVGYLHELRKMTPFVVVEKILTGEEELRQDWPVQGTTGYEFAATAIRLFTNSEAEITRIYQSFTGEKREFKEIAANSKLQALQELFPSEVERLVAMLHRIALAQRAYSDLARTTLHQALLEFIINLPVYRTYKNSAEDREVIERTGSKCHSHPAAIELIKLILLQELPAISAEENEPDLLELPELFKTKFQQFTGAATAKGIEDTAFYRYNRLNCLNDVGAEPDVFTITVAEFHKRMRRQAETFPHTLLATSTHDSKVSEDVRCRLAAISHFPEEWKSLLVSAPEFDQPDRNDQYLFYQMLTGTWPPTPEVTERLKKYMVKAVREAAVHTRWTDSNKSYEDSVGTFIDEVCSSQTFLEKIKPFAEKVVNLGATISLQQLILKLTVPGIPDIYQGSETWDFSLVDPDNRRPVNFDFRRNLLESGEPKFNITKTLLKFRQQNPNLFMRGNYEPIPTAEGIAYWREYEGRKLLVTINTRVPEMNPLQKLVGGAPLPYGVYHN